MLKARQSISLEQLGLDDRGHMRCIYNRERLRHFSVNPIVL